MKAAKGIYFAMLISSFSNASNLEKGLSFISHNEPPVGGSQALLSSELTHNQIKEYRHRDFRTGWFVDETCVIFFDSATTEDVYNKLQAMSGIQELRKVSNCDNF